MTSEARGPLLYAYRPIPANPMTVAFLLIGLVVTFVIGPVAAGPEGLWPLGGLCFVPLTLVHTGIGLETNDGGRLLVRFTPGSIRAFRAESRGYLEAMLVIRHRFAQRRVPMVTTAKTFSDNQVLEMQAQAREPLVPITGVFLAFFLPPSIVAAILIALSVARL